MINQTNNPLFELQQTLYNSGNYTRRRLHRTRYRWVTDAIAEYAPRAPTPKAIEYGPGAGVYLPVLAQHFAQVVAADVEPAYLNGVEAISHGLDNLSLITDDITRSRLPEASFGLVLCSEVLEHTDSPERALANIYRVLHPGGIAIVTTPQRNSLMELCCKVAFLPGVINLVRAIYREPILETGHISLRSSREIEASVANCGFNPLRADKFGLYVPLVAEFGRDAGGRAIEAIESRLINSRLDWMLWTQAYVLQRPES